MAPQGYDKGAGAGSGVDAGSAVSTTVPPREPEVPAALFTTIVPFADPVELTPWHSQPFANTNPAGQGAIQVPPQQTAPVPEPAQSPSTPQVMQGSRCENSQTPSVPHRPIEHVMAVKQSISVWQETGQHLPLPQQRCPGAQSTMYCTQIPSSQRPPMQASLSSLHSRS